MRRVRAAAPDAPRLAELPGLAASHIVYETEEDTL